MNRPSPDDMKAMQVMEYVEELEKDNKELKEKLALTEKDRDEREVKARDMMKENNELKEGIGKLKLDNKIQENHRFFGIYF